MGNHTGCYVPGCTSRSWLNNNLSFFRFPKRKDRCREWSQRIDPALSKMPLEKLNQRRICSLHFTDNQFMNIHRNSLIHCAIPTLHLPVVSVNTGKTEQPGIKPPTTSTLEPVTVTSRGPSTSFQPIDVTTPLHLVDKEHTSSTGTQSSNSVQTSADVSLQSYINAEGLEDILHTPTDVYTPPSIGKRRQQTEFCSDPNLTEEHKKLPQLCTKQFQSEECKKLLKNALPSISSGSDFTSILDSSPLFYNPQTFDCPMCCGKQFSLMDLQQHIARYIWGSLKCPVCDEMCVGLEILAVHLDEHQSALEMTVSENSLLRNVAKSTVSSEESVNISCGDVQTQVIEDQTIDLPDVGKENITVDKSVNCYKNTGGAVCHMEMCEPLKNNNSTSEFTKLSGRNIFDKTRSVKKTDMNVFINVKDTSVGYRTSMLRHKPKLLIRNITSLLAPETPSNLLVKYGKSNFDPTSCAPQQTSQPQSSDEVSHGSRKRNDYNSGTADISYASGTNVMDSEQKLVTRMSETVSTPSTCKTETHVGALLAVDNKHEISCHKCGLSFLDERTYVTHTKQFHSKSDVVQTEHHKSCSISLLKKSSPFGQKLSVIRPFKCQTCNKSFGYKDALHRHAHLHLKDFIQNAIIE